MAREATAGLDGVVDNEAHGGQGHGGERCTGQRGLDGEAEGVRPYVCVISP